MSEEIDYNDLDMVVDTGAIESDGEQQNDDFVVLPKGTYPFTVKAVAFSNYQPKPGKTSGITRPCKKIAISLIVDGGDKGRAWVDENLFFYPSCLFKIVALFRSCNLIPEHYKGAFPWDQLKGSTGLVKLAIDSYHSNKFNDEREKNTVASFVKPSADTPKKTPAAPADDYADVPF